MRIIFGALLLLLDFVVSLNGFNLQCTFQNKFGNGIHFVIGPDKFGCKGLYVNIQSRNQVVTSVNGADLKTFNGSNYKIMEFHNSILHFIPQRLGEFFPDVEVVDFAHSLMKEVNKKDLSQFPKLKQIFLYSTDVQSLPANLFEGNPELLYIYFSNNKLTHVGKGILTPLKKLSSAYFRSNPCIKDPVALSALVAALESGCRNDTIDKFNEENKNTPKKSHSSCEILQSSTGYNEELQKKVQAKEEIIDANRELLMVTSNQAKNLPQDAFENIDMTCNFNSNDKSCEVLNLSVYVPTVKIFKIVHHNKTAIDQSSSPIEKLSIVNQKTLLLPVNIAEKIPKISEISIVNSGLFQFRRETFSGLSLMTSLIIVHNKVIVVPKNSFTDSVNLQYLNFSFNLIEDIDREAFSNLGKLKILDLSHNLLNSLNSEVFSALNSLETLKLNDNAFQILNPRLFNKLSKLTHVDISSNEIVKLTSDLIAPVNAILKFNAADNKLIIFDQLLLNHLKKSELIDFTRNECIDAVYNKKCTNGINFEALVLKVLDKCSEEE